METAREAFQIPGKILSFFNLVCVHDFCRNAGAKRGKVHNTTDQKCTYGDQKCNIFHFWQSASCCLQLNTQKKFTSWHWIFPFLFSREKNHRKYNKFYFKKNKLSGYILITATETIPTWSWTSVEIFIMRNSCWTSRTRIQSVTSRKHFEGYKLQGQRSSNPNIRGQDPHQEICVMWYNICLTNTLKFNVATLDLQTASGLSFFFPLCAFSPSNHPQHQCTQT